MIVIGRAILHPCSELRKDKGKRGRYGFVR
jgi:hypothetical protein